MQPYTAGPNSDPFDPFSPSSNYPPPSMPRALAVDLPSNILRPVAFRIFTKKHNLTLKSDALNALSLFVGRQCGATWRTTGSGEKVLDEIARLWKRNQGTSKVLVDDSDALQSILRGLEAAQGQAGSKETRRESTTDLSLFASERVEVVTTSEDPYIDGEQPDSELNPQAYLSVIDAHQMPKWAYSPLKKRFQRASNPSSLPPASTKAASFRNRYHMLYQRLLRNEAFFSSNYIKSTAKNSARIHSITSVSALLGRACQSFLLFGMISASPAGILSLCDPSGEIIIDLSLAYSIPENASWFCPGMFCIVDGIYEENGRFTVFSIAQPPPERRDATADICGHADFLGNGVTLDMSVTAGGQLGRAMRNVERTLTRVRWVVAGELALDRKLTLRGLRKLFQTCSSDPPLLFLLVGNFASTALFPNTESTLKYKEGFDELASILEEFPALTRSSGFVFVPGSNDAWAGTFAGGASSVLPQKCVPELFTSRIKQLFYGGHGEVRWASNPCRVSYFTSEVVISRDDILGRLERTAVGLKPRKESNLSIEEEIVEHMEMDNIFTTEDVDICLGKAQEKVADVLDSNVKTARKLVKTILDQGYLSPFSFVVRPVLWDFAHTLSLYPLPTSLILCEPAMQPFAITYEGCHVMNPGSFMQRKQARWIEYMPAEKKGKIIIADV